MQIVPEVLIENNCEDIGEKNEMYIAHVKPKIKEKFLAGHFL